MTPRHTLCLPILLIVAGCAGTAARIDANPRFSGLSCAPFARTLTQVNLRGDADAWWSEASGRYLRVHRPMEGAILVFRADDRLPHGHVSVVSQVLDSRRIRVVQANWVAGELERDDLVIDVSEQNDWSLVRVWWPPIGAIGRHAYPVYGFILPPVRMHHDALVRQAAAAAAETIDD